MPPLKLVALDLEDLKIVSAHLQDAVMRVADLAYLPKEQRFAAIVNRFDWTVPNADIRDRRTVNQRLRTALRFEHVTAVKRQSIVQSAPGAVLSLLAIRFEETAAPSGVVTLVFAGGGALRLDVECVEAEMRDLGPIWTTPNRPDHDQDDDTKGSG